MEGAEGGQESMRRRKCMQQIRRKKLTKATNKPTEVRSLATGSYPAFLRLHIVEDAIAPCPRRFRHKRRSGCGLEGLPTNCSFPSSLEK